jgi:hypothetical protein
MVVMAGQDTSGQVNPHRCPMTGSGEALGNRREGVICDYKPCSLGEITVIDCDASNRASGHNCAVVLRLALPV